MPNFSLFKKFHAYLLPILYCFIIAILFDVIVILLGLLNPMLTRVLFDYAYQYKNLTLLNVTIAAIVVTYFVYFFLNVISDYLKIYVNQEAIAKLTSDVFYSIQCLPLRFHREKSSGDLLIRITDDVSNTINTVMNVLPTFILDGGRLIIILLIAFYANSTLTLLAIASIPLYVLETKYYAKRLQDVESESIKTDSDIYSWAQERISGIKTIKAFAQEKAETISFGKLIKRRYHIYVKGRLLDVLRTFTNSITLQMWSVFLIWYLGFEVVQGKLTIGEIVALMLYLEQMSEPIGAFSGLATSWKTSLVSMQRLDEVLSYPKEMSQEFQGKEFALKEGNIETHNLSFSYAPPEKVLHDIDVKFLPHSLTAIVGASGSGKTTLVNLLMRFFDATQGTILIDGQDISEVKVKSLRNRVGLVSQEYTLFDGTILENILYGNPGKTRDDAVKAAQLAAAYDFISKMPNGFETGIGPGGELISGGQRQRIAIARTLLKDPKVVIFDEATAALDAESEFHIQEVISKLKLTKTVIIIAHRLSTIKTADKIMVLEEGRFVEEGRFQELLEKRGAFYKYYWKQFGGLAIFRQQIGLEMERAVRYGSHFCLAIFKYLEYQNLVKTEGDFKADQFMDELDLTIKKHIRMGDNTSILDQDTILILLPEISAGQLSAFFERLMKVMKTSDVLLVGSRISKRAFRTPEELIRALLKKATKTAKGIALIEENELT